MPICTNPDCGEISKTKTRFCPHCGQESLSFLDKQGFSTPKETVLTTETFETETASAFAPKEGMQQKKENSNYFFRAKAQISRIPANKKSLVAFILFSIIFVYVASPDLLKDSVFQKLGFHSAEKNGTYMGELTPPGAVVSRSMISTGTSECGGGFPDSVLKLDFLIPRSWGLIEDNGCGSGSSYTWTNPRDFKEFVELGFSATAGWCGEFGPNDLDQISNEFVGEVENFRRLELTSGENIYAYTKSVTNSSQSIYGVLQVEFPESPDGGCNGQTFFETTEKVQRNSVLFNGMIKAIFG